MEKWEYLYVSFRAADMYPSINVIGTWSDDVEQKSARGTVNEFLNAFGEDGWELVSFDLPLAASNAAVLKRRKA